MRPRNGKGPPHGHISDYLFSELPTSRRRIATSAVAHYIAGVLDGKSMEHILESLFRAAEFSPGDKVRTLRGSLRGVIVKILDDGRVKWRADTGTEFLGLELEVRGCIEGSVRGFRRAVLAADPRLYKLWTPKNSKWAG